MSGVEIAGLALAVLPILIAAVDYSRSRRLDPKRAEFMENLAFEITLLHMSLTKLANGLTELPDDLREILSSQDLAATLQENWRREEVVYALKNRLGTGHETFRVTLASILECLEKLLENKSLSLSNDEAILPDYTYTKLSAIRDKSKSTPTDTLSQRIRFTVFEAKKNRKLLRKIKENNEKLEKIVLWSSDGIFATSDPPKDGRSVGAPQIELRPLMQTLYEALEQLWSCDCSQRHEARLCLLQHRDTRRDSVVSDTSDEDLVYFDMLMSLKMKEKESYCRWLESQLCIALQQENDSQSNKVVQFESPPNSPGVTSIGTQTISGRRRSSTATRKKIEQICKTIRQAEKHLCAPQILLDDGCLWHVTSKVSSRRLSRPSNMNGSAVDTSLASLLKEEKKLKRKDKLILSVILANSLLHFCESPWLSREWSKDHITFFSPSSKEAPDIRRPYLSTDFREDLLQESEDDDDDADALYRIHPSPSVLALGILLLELEFDSAIESNRCADDLDEDGNPNVNTDYCTALRLLEDISDNIYVNHQKAVSACLNCDFFDPDTVQPSLDDPEFRQAVYDNIVRPLEMELENGYDIHPESLMELN